MKTPPKEYFDFLKTYGKEITDVETTKEDEQIISKLASIVRKQTSNMLRHEAIKLRKQGY